MKERECHKIPQEDAEVEQQPRENKSQNGRIVGQYQQVFPNMWQFGCLYLRKQNKSNGAARQFCTVIWCKCNSKINAELFVKIKWIDIKFNVSILLRNIFWLQI